MAQPWSPKITCVAIGALSSARVWCSAQEMPLEKSVPGRVCIDSNVATSDFFENKSWVRSYKTFSIRKLREDVKSVSVSAPCIDFFVA
jgi:hypothetical protein